MGQIIPRILVLVVAVVIITNIRIVPQAHAYVMERLGVYHVIWETGLHVETPFIDRISEEVSLKEQVIDFLPQPVITKGNVMMQIDTVVCFQITDPKPYVYGVERSISTIENLSATTLRNTIGEPELDTILTSRDVISSKARTVLDEAIDAWGIKVNRVELKNILSPPAIQDSMERQMKVERDRRAIILDTEDQKRSVILIAEGQKEAATLATDTQKQPYILEAQDEVQAIMSAQQALVDSLKPLNEAAPSDCVTAFESLEAPQKAADDKATKIIIPFEVQGLAGFATSVKELSTEDPQGEKPNRAKQTK